MNCLLSPDNPAVIALAALCCTSLVVIITCAALIARAWRNISI